MSILSFSSPETVLILSDDSLSVYFVSGRKVDFIDDLEWGAPALETTLSDLLSKECKGAPVTILNDMVEQHYRKERLPKVSFIDKGPILKRRLKIVFPNYPVRAALESKLKTVSANSSEQSKSINKGKLYLFAAVALDKKFSAMMRAVQRSEVKIKGYGLLPIESAGMIETLARKLGGDDKSTTRWVIFMGQHRSGGLRQIITRNGELALTRMTAIQGFENDNGLWARDSVAELKSTMGYLSRFGYTDKDTLDIVIMAGPESAKHLKAMIDVPCRLHVMGPEGMASTLGVKIEENSLDAIYADIFHASWIARKQNLTLPMQARHIDEIQKPQQIAALLMLIMLGTFAYFGYQIFNSSRNLLAVSEQLDLKKQDLQKVEADYQIERQRQKSLGLDVAVIRNSLTLYEELEQSKMKSVPMFDTIAKAMGPSLKLDRISLEKNIPLENRYDNNNNEEEAKAKAVSQTAVLNLSFNPTVAPENAIAEINKLKARLEQMFPGFDVEITKQAFNMDVSQSFVGEAESFDAQSAEQSDLTAELTMTGVM